MPDETTRYYTRYLSQVTGPYPRSMIGRMAQSRRLTRGHEVSSDRQHWIPLEEFLVQDVSGTKSEPRKDTNPSYRATYRMEKLDERFASQSGGSRKRSDNTGGAHVGAKMWIVGGVVLLLVIGGMLIFLMGGGSGGQNNNGSDNPQAQSGAPSSVSTQNTNSNNSAPVLQRTYTPAASPASGGNSYQTNSQSTQASISDTKEYTGGAVAAGSVLLINGTTRTILNPAQQSAQGGSLASRTIFTKPFITTGAGDRAFGHDGYVIFGTSPAGTTSGVWVGANPLAHPFIPAGTASSSKLYIGPSPLKYSLKTLMKLPPYLTVSVNGFNGITAGYSYPSLYARDGSRDDMRESGVAGRAENTPFETPTTMATLRIIAKPPANLYVGVMAGQYYDSLSAITLINTRTGRSATAVPQIYYKQTLPGALWYFFDVAGAKTGDVLKVVESQYNTGASDDQHPGLPALTFDSFNPIDPHAAPPYRPASSVVLTVARPARSGGSSSRSKATSPFTGSVTAANVHTPVWLKLVRRGDIVSAYYSHGGRNWMQLGVAEHIDFGHTTIRAGLAVCAHNNSLLNTSRFSHVAITAARSSWLDSNIGYPGKLGSARESNGTWTVTGGGSDVWDQSDQFNLLSRFVPGTTVIKARVDSLTNTDGWAKAGVMLRGSTSATAPFAFIFVTPHIGLAFQWRPHNSAN